MHSSQRKIKCLLSSTTIFGTGTSPKHGDKTIYSIGTRLKAFSDWLLKTMVSGKLDAIFPAATREYAPLIEELWNDSAIKATYERRNEIEMLPSVASYFLERVQDHSFILSLYFINSLICVYILVD
jgi:hypothetical protein